MNSILYKQQKQKQMFKIYTKKGDSGTTSTYSGERKPKYDALFHTHGAIDDLIGKVQWVVYTLKKLNCNEEQKNTITNQLIEITKHLFVLQTILSTTNPKFKRDNENDKKKFDFLPQVNDLEQNIDTMTNDMPKLTSFIIPGGNECNLRANDTRVQTRFCERLCLQYATESGHKEYLEEIGGLKFLNRLSDYFFTIERYVNYIDNDLPQDQKEVTIKIKSLFV